jgi:hypothetical protein
MARLLAPEPSQWDPAARASPGRRDALAVLVSALKRAGAPGGLRQGKPLRMRVSSCGAERKVAASVLAADAAADAGAMAVLTPTFPADRAAAAASAAWQAAVPGLLQRQHQRAGTPGADGNLSAAATPHACQQAPDSE